MKANDVTEVQVNRLLTMKEAAKSAGIGYNTLLGAAEAGQLTTIPIGSHKRVTVNALNGFISQLEAGVIVLRPA